MRFEAKHRFFKRMAHVLGNFTNICYSLALRHQLHQCYVQLDKQCLPGDEIEVGPGICACVLIMNTYMYVNDNYLYNIVIAIL